MNKSIYPQWRWPGLGQVAGWLVLVWLLAVAALPALGGVVGTVHNLSVNGPGTVKASSETAVCVFCHTVHHAGGETPLWNHSMSSVSNYVVYSSARLTGLGVTVPQPNGSSRLCLSCHDGTVALGSVTSGAPDIAMQGGVTKLSKTDPDYIGTDLSGDHPISFIYDATLAGVDTEVKSPTLPAVKARLDSQSQVQCTSCHDPHNNNNGNFLVMDNTGSALCLTCHNPGAWGSSAHALSTTAVPLVLANRTTSKAVTAKPNVVRAKVATIATMACESCHANHQAGTRQKLLVNRTLEQNCLVCHDGATAQKNVAADFQKPSIHPITINSTSHLSTEDPVNPKERHVVCADCHNAHAANATPATAPNVSGALNQVTGVSAAGGVIKPVLREYELCFRCHADSLARGPATVSRQFVQTNTRLQFSTANQSYHPVEAAGRNPSSVPSLISPWTPSSLTYCTDCHNSDSSTKAGGTGANGPHGSVYAPILERNLAVTDFQPESAAAYALCYKCHSRDSILANQSFPWHRSHVADKQTACTTCHDSHGVVNAPHLINFNTTYVTPSSNGRLEYLSTGQYRGVCSLTCHGVDHNAKSY